MNTGAHAAHASEGLVALLDPFAHVSTLICIDTRAAVTDSNPGRTVSQNASARMRRFSGGARHAYHPAAAVITTSRAEPASCTQAARRTGCRGEPRLTNESNSRRTVSATPTPQSHRNRR